MTFSLDLLFSAFLKGELPGPPLAQVYVKTHSKDERGFILITCDCLSLLEIEAEIDRLKGELESIKKKARRKFATVARPARYR